MRRILVISAVLVATAASCGGTGDGRSDRPTATSAPTSVPTTTTTTLVAAAGECGLTGSYPEPWPQRPRYSVELTVDPEAGEVEGTMHVSFTPPEATDRLVFRLWANGPRAGQGGGRLEITRAVVDERETDGSYDSGNAGPGTPGTIYTLTRDQGFAAGETTAVDLDFTLRMPGAINERVAKVGNSLRLGSVLPLLAWVRGRGWHTSPAVGNFSEAVSSEVADYRVRVAVPDGFTVLATGEEVEPGVFVATAVRDWAATVARMDVAEGTAQGGRTRVIVGVAQGSGDNLERRLADTIESLDGHASRYGPYPYPVLSVGITGSLSGGIEFPQHIQLGAGTSRDHLVHEVAHMWFYALVGNDQYADPWLDEGLTEYAESRYLGNTVSTRNEAIPEYGRGRLGESHEYWQRSTDAFFRSVYVQGLQAVAAVGDYVGGLEEVDCALRNYVLDHAYGVTRPADLAVAIQEQTGFDPRPVFASFGAAT